MTAGAIPLAPLSAEPIAVLGAGIVGLSIALRLAEAGWTVEVFDQGTAGHEASWAGAGMLAPGGEIEFASPLSSFALASRRSYRAFVTQLERESGLAIDMQEAGALELAYSPQSWTRLNAKANVQQELGIASRSLGPDQVSTFWPRVRRDNLIGARFYPEDAIVNPRDIVSALQIILPRRGVRIHEREGVKQLAITQESAIVTAGSRSRPFAAAVLAMGAWSSSLPVSGVPPVPAAEPVKGHLIAYHQPEQTCSTIIRLGHTYMLQRANGMLLVGASVEHVGFDRTIQSEIVADLAEQASAVFPHLAETTPTEAWVGFRPGADTLQLGPWHSARLHLAYGHYRNGILLAPATAEHIAGGLNASLGMH